MGSRPAALAWSTAANEAAGQAWGEQLNTFVGQLPGGDPQESLNIASGAVTPSKSSIIVDAEGGAGPDDLTHILTSILPVGSIVTVRCANAGRVITIKNGAGGTGQILTFTGLDIVLDDVKSRVSFIQNSSNHWEELRRKGTSESQPTVTFTEVSGSPRAVLAGESGTFFKSDSAAAAQNYANLPAAFVGGRFTFGSDSTFGFRVNANGTDTIQRGTATSSAGGNYAVAADGTVVVLVCWKAGQWVVESEIGTAGAVA